jgi:hypothetical protein
MFDNKNNNMHSTFWQNFFQKNGLLYQGKYQGKISMINGPHGHTVNTLQTTTSKSSGI